MKTNIAECFKARYESEDFKANYLQVLSEVYTSNKDVIIDRIIDLFNVSNYETQKYLSNWFAIDREQASKIYYFIDENLNQFVKDFHHAYVGYTSLESVSFGEQEEQLEGIYNHKTGKAYSLPYLRKVFDKAGFYVSTDGYNKNYAYLDMSYDGLHIGLLANTELLDNFLNEIRSID